MSNIMGWLPERLHFENYNNNWIKFLDDAYSIFLNDFCKDDLFLGQVIIDFDRIIINNRCEAFRHIIEGQQQKGLSFSENALIRAERIAWIKPIIQNYEKEYILKWENKRGRKNKFILWLKDIENMGYKVVFQQKKSGKLFLETAYPTNWKRYRESEIKEYNAYMSSKRRPI